VVGSIRIEQTFDIDDIVLPAALVLLIVSYLF